MAPSLETQNQDSEKKQESAGQAPEKVSVPIERRTHLEVKDHQKDNAEFLAGMEKTDEQTRKRNIEQAAKWQSDGDIDLLRSAGLSLDQVRQSPMERHIHLAAIFLERQKDQPGLYFRINPSGHEGMQWNVDLADIFPANNISLDIYAPDGKLICAGAVRGFFEGRPGYFNPKTRQRILLEQGMGVRVRETQSAMALRDPVYGHQANSMEQQEQAYLTKNAQKSVIKDHARKEAAKQGKTLVTDKSFFDIFLEDITNAWNSSGLADPNNPLKLDFKNIEQQIQKLLESFGLAIGGTAANSSSSGAAPGTVPSSTPSTPVPSSTAKPSEYRETHESRNSPKIDRKWLMENVGSNEREVQAKLVPINFLGTNLRVCKYIAPYLKEAESRAKTAGLAYRADPKQTSCFNWRPIRGGNTLSMHSWGTAIDINSIDNPWQPGLRNNPNNRNRVKTNMPPEFVAIMRDVGMKQLWWDPMHFELAVNPFQNRQVLHSAEAQELAEKYLG